MTREEIEYILKRKDINTLLYEAELARREDLERFIKHVPSYVPRDKGIWIHTGNGMWEQVKDKIYGGGFKYEVFMMDNVEDFEKLKERSHKIAELMLIKEYKMLKRYVLLEFYDYLKRQDDWTLEEVKIDLENDIKDSTTSTMLHKWRKARAEVCLMLINKICEVYPRLTDKSPASELANIVENLKDIE